MIATAALGDVVEQRRDVQQPMFVVAGHQLATERKFVCVIGDRKTTQVADHHQDVLINGIDMKQVMLHAPDDSPEDR